MSEKTFRPWEIDQTWLFPPSVRDFVPEGHLAHVIRDVVREELDLSAIFSHYTELRGYRSRYRLRKHTVEPVFGQIKECRNFRRFLHRGIEKVTAEWQMLCTAHNLLKLAAARA